ncbi:MAG: CPBP family intramembrane metalloprotease [Acidimicrobiales bacterium]|nr:CPBP family intramembrane metalloprotease [Acidimicrobiales bacterium]
MPVLEPDAPTRRVPRWGCGDIVYGILAMLGLSTAVGVAVALVADRGAVDLDSPGFTVIGAVAVWIGLGGWALLASRRKGYGTLRSDYHYYFEWYDLLIGLAGAIAAFGLQIAIGAVAMNSGIEPDTNTAPIVEAKGSPGWVVVVAIVVGVGAPFVEELFFRGLTYGALERRFDRWVALGGSTAIFGVMHLQPTANLPGLVVLILQITSIGLVLGFLRMMTNRCGASIVTHMIVNTVATVLVLAGVGGV